MWYRFAGVPRKFFTNPVEGGFYVGDRPIAYGQKMSVSEWVSLLNTKYEYLKSQEDLNKFLSNPKRFEMIDNQLSYKRRFNKKDLYNLISEFYVGNRKINLNEKMTLTEWVHLLKTDIRNIDDQEKLDEFLSDPERFEIIDSHKIYIKNTQNEGTLRIPFEFYIGDDKIPKDKKFGIMKLSKILSISYLQILNQNMLNDFFSDTDRFKKDKNGNIQYFPKKASRLESLFQKRIRSSDDHNIKIVPQKIIKISNKILKFDFAFMYGEKISLVVEINGRQHYGFVSFGNSIRNTYKTWQNGLKRDVMKINYCHNNNIPLLIFNHMLSLSEFETIIENLNKNPHIYDQYIPQHVMDENISNTSLEFIKRQIYSHLYPVFNNVISFKNDESKKRYIKDTLILISKLLGIYEDGIDKTDYIETFDTNVDLTSYYNICLSIYNSLYPDFPLDKDEKITYSDLSKPPRLQKEKSLIKEPTEITPSEE